MSEKLSASQRRELLAFGGMGHDPITDALAALETLLRYARWQIGPESTSHHPTLPSATAAAEASLDKALEHLAARAEARPAVDREGEPSEDFIRLVAEAMGARTGYSISLTRLVDGVETYTLSMDGYEPQDFDDRDEAAEVLHQRLNRNRAKRLLALLSPATSPGEGSSAAAAARIASDHAASETLRKSEEG